MKEEVNIMKTNKTRKVIENGKIRCILNISQDGDLLLESLYNIETGFEWASIGGPTGIHLSQTRKKIIGFTSSDGFKPACISLYKLKNGATQTKISLIEEKSGIEITSFYTIYPDLPILSYRCKIENIGKIPLPEITGFGPFCVRIKKDIFPCIFYNIPAIRGKEIETVKKEVPLTERIVLLNKWTAIENIRTNNLLFIASDLSGHDVLPLKVVVEPEDNSILLYASIGELDEETENHITYILNSNESVESPEIFLALTYGDLDDACNEIRYSLNTFVLPKPVLNLPLLSYNVWYTEADAEKLYLQDLEFASRMGFDCFVLDASWYEGSSVIPGSNNWTAGLGSYKESTEKFPHGMNYLSQKVHEKGMKFGIWVDPQNVDRRRVLSGEIPQEWVAQINGKDLECWHPSLSPTTQLCLGNPEVVEWLKEQLSTIIQEWHVDWIKWDPSATVSYFCNRTDHGHKESDGAYAYMKGRQEILSYLLKRFPDLLGWECIPDLRNARINPGCSYILPAYNNIFVTGPMLGPYVWGSMHMAFQTADSRYSVRIGTYYEASYLDYYFRNLMVQGGLSMGNITGLVSQRLKNAPLGFNDAFKRNIIHFKQYRHLYNENIYHLEMDVPEKWRAIEYCKRDGSEAIVFIFRDGSSKRINYVKLRGLDISAKYLVSSLNERPGKEKIITGEKLVNEGLEVELPSQYLATADYKIEELEDSIRKEIEKQVQYGSDILILTRIT